MPYKLPDTLTVTQWNQKRNLLAKAFAWDKQLTERLTLLKRQADALDLDLVNAARDRLKDATTDKQLQDVQEAMKGELERDAQSLLKELVKLIQLLNETTRALGTTEKIRAYLELMRKDATTQTQLLTEQTKNLAKNVEYRIERRKAAIEAARRVTGPDILQNPRLLQAFRQVAKVRFAAESVEYAELPADPGAWTSARARYETYIVSSAPKEINLSYKVRGGITDMMDALTAVAHLLPNAPVADCLQSKTVKAELAAKGKPPVEPARWLSAWAAAYNENITLMRQLVSEFQKTDAAIDALDG